LIYQIHECKLLKVNDSKQSFQKRSKSLENQFSYPIPKGSKLIFFAPLGAGVNEENQLFKVHIGVLTKYF